MNSLLVCTRALHFVAVLMAFGGLVLALVVVGPATQAAEPAALAVRERVGKFLWTSGWWGLGLSMLSGAAWLLLEAALMSGHPIDEALSSGALQSVLTRTAFGRVWAWRFGLAVALGALMFRPALGAGARQTRTSGWVALALAGSYLATLALIGHSGSGSRADHYLQTAADAVHLVAAGAWVGALPGLAVVFATATRESSAASLRVAAAAARRFSAVGIASVGALLASGVVNAWYLVGDVPALFGTRYGQLLVAKVMLFATMVTLAAVNRRRLTPLAERGNGSALRLLTRNAVLEFAMGIAVVAIVGALGVAVPAAHQSPVWPFGFTLSLAQVERSVPARWLLGACIATVCLIALFVAIARALGERIGLQTAVAYAAVVTAAALVATWLLAVPAYPTSYAISPVSYTATAIISGSASYNASCVQCHGPHGRGDGPMAAALPIKPVDLVEHAAHHRPGNLFWWIAHGIRNTPMPAFSARLDDAEIWSLVLYLRALADSRTAQALTSHVQPDLAITAPDFAFEEALHTQGTLWQLRGREVLLVSGTLPQSLPRLLELEAQRAELAKAGIRVILMATSHGAMPEDERAMPRAPGVALVGTEVMETYAMFACPEVVPCAPSAAHAEWLIDREGSMRARWPGVSVIGADRTAEVIAEARQLRTEPSRPPAQQEHGH